MDQPPDFKIIVDSPVLARGGQPALGVNEHSFILYHLPQDGKVLLAGSLVELGRQRSRSSSSH